MCYLSRSTQPHCIANLKARVLSSAHACTQLRVICIGLIVAMHCAASRTVSGSISGCVTADFFRSYRQNHVPWGRLSLWKWVPGISPGVKATGAFDWRSTTLVVPNVKKIRGLNLPGTPWAISACFGRTLVDHCNYWRRRLLLGVFAKWRKTTVSFVMSVRPAVSVRMEQPSCHWTDFQALWYLIFLPKVWLKSNNNNEYWPKYIFYIAINSSL
jgi:hypothetical protein